MLAWATLWNILLTKISHLHKHLTTSLSKTSGKNTGPENVDYNTTVIIHLAGSHIYTVGKVLAIVSKFALKEKKSFY